MLLEKFLALSLGGNSTGIRGLGLQLSGKVHWV